MSETVKPLPCPVCGKAPCVGQNVNDYWFVECSQRGSGLTHEVSTLTFQLDVTETEAIEHWNAIVNATRAATIQKIEPKVIFNER